VTRIDPLAGTPAGPAQLIDVPKLLAAYSDLRPDPGVSAQRVGFGTSGHRGSPFERSFNEWHVLAICQAVCEYRKQQGVSSKAFIQKDCKGYYRGGHNDDGRADDRKSDHHLR